MAQLDLKNIYEWPKSTKMLIFGLVFAVTAYLGYIWDVADLRSSLVEAVTQEDTIKQQLEQDVTRRFALQNDISRYPALTTLLKDWQMKLVKQPEISDLLNQILKMGAANHIYFNEFNPGDVVKDGVYIKLPIKMVIVGSYHEMGDFISQVANMPTIVVVSNFRVSNENKNDMLGEKLAAQANAQNLLTGEFNLEIYRMSENEASEPVKDKTEKDKNGSKP